MQKSVWVKRTTVLAAVLFCLAVVPAFAGFDEGRIAYEREDWSTALFEMRPLALRGEARAQYVLGLTYQFGRGVPQDEAQAFHWYMLAAMQGYRAGQTKVGVMYYVGRGVPQDYKQAIVWLRKSAEQNDARAMGTLGRCYLLGQGVAQDYVLAYALFNLAGPEIPEAREARTALGKDLSKDQVEEGQAISRQLARPGEFLKALDAAAAR